MKIIKNLFIGLTLIGVGIFGTIGYQNYVIDFNVEVTADSTKVDSSKVVIEISPVVADTTVKADSAK